MGDGPIAGFAIALRRLRQAAGGPGYRELARLAHYSPTTLADAARGEKLPSLAVTLAFVRACGGDPDEWSTRWHDVATQLTGVRHEAGDKPAPYLGLTTFQCEDSHLFFGRDQLVDELTEQVSTRRFTAVFGPSGAGKSSLLRAGLAPRFAHVVVMAPGAHPVEECAARLAETTGVPAATPASVAEEIVLVVDQFEEIFTLCAAEAERAAFIAMLAAVARAEGGPARVVLGVRADFYARCADHPDLVAALRGNQVLIGPPAAEDLREIVVRPARERGYVVESALLAAIVADAVGQAGALPLVSHALLETWRRRRGNTLTLAGYQAAGGIDGALATTAEQLYTSLTDSQQRVARDLLLRLTAIGEGTEPTRRRVARTELDPDIAPLLELLAGARLVTLDESTVTLAHEALIRAWPRLGRWLRDDLDGLRVHRQLTEAAQAWRSLDRDDGALYRGVRLTLAREWLADRRPELTAAEREFLDASVRHADAEQAAVTRRARALHYLLTGLAVLVVIAVVLGVVAWHQRGNAIAMHRVAVSREVAGQAIALANSQPDTAMLLGATAFGLSPTVEARGALLSAAANDAYQAELTGHSDAVSQAVFSRDGEVLATVSRDRTLSLWDVAARRRTAVLTGHDTWLRAVALSPDGRHAVTGGDDDAAVVWDLRTGETTATLAGHRGRVQAIELSPDGSTLITADDTGLVQFWRFGDWAGPVATAQGSDGLRAMAVSQDGRTLLTTDEHGVVTVWDLAGRTVRATVTAHTGPVAAVAMSSDGQLFATAGYDDTVGVWRAGDGSAVSRLTGHAGHVRAVAFTPDDTTLVSVGDDHTIMLWDTRLLTARARLTGLTHNVYTLVIHPRTGQVVTAGEDRKIVLWDATRPTLVLGSDGGGTGEVAHSANGRWLATAHHSRAVVWDNRRRRPLAHVPGPVSVLAFSGDSRWLATADVTRSSVDVWDVRTMTRVAELPGHRDGVLDVEFSPDSTLLAVGGLDHTIALWDVRRATRHAELIGHNGPVDGLAFSSDGRLLASAGHDELVMVWDVVRRRATATLEGHQGWVRDVAFSSDGRTLASASIDRTVRVWDVPTRRHLTTLTGHADAAKGVTFSPDGRLLAFTSDDETVTLWDLAGRTPVARLTGHTAAADAIAFSPDGGTLASVGRDHTAILFPVEPATATARVCSAMRRDLTTTEWARHIPDVDPIAVCPRK